MDRQIWWMDNQIDYQRSHQMERQKEGWKEWWIDRAKFIEPLGRKTDKQIDRGKDGWADGQADERTDGQRENSNRQIGQQQMNVQIDREDRDGKVGKWMDRQTNGQMDERTEGERERRTCRQTERAEFTGPLGIVGSPKSLNSYGSHPICFFLRELEWKSRVHSIAHSTSQLLSCCITYQLIVFGNNSGSFPFPFSSSDSKTISL